MNSLNLIKKAIAVLEASIEDKYEGYKMLYKKDRQLDYLYDLWEYYNKTLFDNKLPKVGRLGFNWKKKTENKRALGGFTVNSNTFMFDPGIFQLPFNKFRDMFLHEMCHQAQHYVGIPGDKNFIPAIKGKINILRGHEGLEWDYWTGKLGVFPGAVSYITDRDISKDRHKEYLSNKLGKELKTVKKRK